MKTKVLGVFLTMLLVASIFTVPVYAAISPADSSSDFTVYDGELLSYDGSGGAVTIPDDVTSIGECAFDSAQGSAVTSIAIPEGVTDIEDYAFNGCSNLTSITIPDSVAKMGDGVFGECTNILNVTFQGNLSCISDDTFEDCTSLKSITFPNGITVIGSSAFSGCTALSNLTIPSTVTSINMMAFDGCTNLNSITIPSSVKSIANYAFSDCSTHFLINCTAGSYAETYAASNYLNYSTKVVSVSVSAKPSKLYYKKGQALDLSGGTLQVKYGDGSTQKVLMTSAKASGFNSNTDGSKTIILVLGGVSCNFTVVIDTTLPKITVQKAKGYTLLHYSDANYSSKSLTLNGKVASWPSNGHLTQKGTYKATVSDKAGNTQTVTFKI